jgi:hypothetical protein
MNDDQTPSPLVIIVRRVVGEGQSIPFRGDLGSIRAIGVKGEKIEINIVVYAALCGTASFGLWQREIGGHVFIVLFHPATLAR